MEGIRLKVRVYIDGFNFYYGCLNGSPYKWLDPVVLFTELILPQHIPNITISTCDIKFFTADILGKAAKSESSVEDQETYLRALKLRESKLSLIKGNYSITPSEAYLIDPNRPKAHPKDCIKVDVWKMEEKQSDVNIAVEALYDVMTCSDLDCVVFVTNGTDLGSALRKIKSLNGVMVGLVLPIKAKAWQARKPNKELIQYADWYRSHIGDDELNRAQLPHKLDLGGRKVIRKPDSWFGQTDILANIFDVLMPAFGNKRNKCWQWLETTKPECEGLPTLSDLPIRLLDEETDALKVLEHAKAYAHYTINR